MRAVSERESVRDRLQLYLVPRMQYLDVIGLAGAAARGKADLAAYWEVVNRCGRELIESKTPLSTCTRGDLEARIVACRNPSWLPF